jgi:uncharacterized protein
VSPALTLWTLDDIVLVSSAYAIAEAERNLDESERRTRLYRLIQKVEIVDEPPHDAALPAQIRLPAKDAPILLAAIRSGCTYLLTGDRKHFGHLLGQDAGGVKVLTVRA